MTSRDNWPETTEKSTRGLRWLVDLACADLDAPSSATVREWRRRLLDFLGVRPDGAPVLEPVAGSVTVSVIDVPLPWQANAAMLRQFQGDARAVLAQALLSRSAAPGAPIGPPVLVEGRAVERLRRRGDGGLYRSIECDGRSAFVRVALDVVQAADAALGRCRDPQCRLVFVAASREGRPQEYCCRKHARAHLERKKRAEARGDPPAPAPGPDPIDWTATDPHVTVSPSPAHRRPTFRRKVQR